MPSASLRALSDTMAATHQHYIRCLKPNMVKKAELFHGDVLTRQLKYTGCAAVVEIQRSGYPVSLSHGEFLGRYRCIALSLPQLCSTIARASAALALLAARS